MKSETVITQHIKSASDNITCEFTEEAVTKRVTTTVGDGIHA